MDIEILGIDIAKNVFQLHGIDAQGKALFKKRLRREKLVKEIAQLPPCIIAMEACSSAHYWARKFRSLGHEAKLINAKFIKPYVKANKNDAHDAQAIAEAASRSHMRFIPIKTIEQQDIQGLHRIRSRLVHNRTGLVNQIRGLLAEYGLIAPQGISVIRSCLQDFLEDAENELSDLSRSFFANLYNELQLIDKQISNVEKEIKQLCESNEDCKRLMTIPGIGILSASALIAAIGNIEHFKNGRHLAAWLGLVPKQHSSGEKNRLLGISKRGNKYIRTLLVHGARSVMLRCGDKQDRRSQWIIQKIERSCMNKTAVAVASRNARIVWALLSKQKDYCAAA